MSAPSSVETSTSTGSGDWPNRRGVVDQPRPLSAAGLLPAGPLSHVSLGDEVVGRAPNSGWTVRDHPPTHTRKGKKNTQTTGEGRGSQFFSSYLLESFCFFFLFCFCFSPQNIKRSLSLPYSSWYWLGEWRIFRLIGGVLKKKRQKQLFFPLLSDHHHFTSAAAENSSICLILQENELGKQKTFYPLLCSLFIIPTLNDLFLKYCFFSPRMDLFN